MKLFNSSVAVCAVVFFCGPIAAAPKRTMVIVTRPTVVAFFPLVNETELSNNPDENEALADFQYYAARVRERAAAIGFDFVVTYAPSFRVKRGTKTIEFRPHKAQCGYYFVEPAKSPRVEYGVTTDDDIVRIVSEYFHIVPK